MTPKITPTLRSIPFARDWLILGCTTSRAAIAAKIGSGWLRVTVQISHAMMAATEVLITWRSGLRDEARSEAISRIRPEYPDSATREGDHWPVGEQDERSIQTTGARLLSRELRAAQVSGGRRIDNGGHDDRRRPRDVRLGDAGLGGIFG